MKQIHNRRFICTFSGIKVWKRSYCLLSRNFSDRIIFFALFNVFPGIISYIDEVLNSPGGKSETGRGVRKLGLILNPKL